MWCFQPSMDVRNSLFRRRFARAMWVAAGQMRATRTVAQVQKSYGNACAQRSVLSTNAIKDTVSVLYWYEELSSFDWQFLKGKIFGSPLFFCVRIMLLLLVVVGESRWGASSTTVGAVGSVGWLGPQRRPASQRGPPRKSTGQSAEKDEKGEKVLGVRHSGFPSHH